MAVAKYYLMTKGYLAQLLQKSPAAIEGVLQAFEIEPEFCINGVDHYGEPAYRALANHFDKLSRVAGNADA